MVDSGRSQRFIRPALLVGLPFLAVAATAVLAMAWHSQLPRTAATPVASRELPTKPDPDAWPAKTEDQIRSTRRLLGALKLLPDAPDGQSAPILRAAIRDYQRMAGLEETGEVSQALFASLKEMVALVAPNLAPKPN